MSKEYDYLRHTVYEVLDTYEFGISATVLNHEEKLKAIKSDLKNILKDTILDRGKIEALYSCI